MTLHCIALRYTTLHYFAYMCFIVCFPKSTLLYIDIKLHYTALHYTSLHCIKLYSPLYINYIINYISYILSILWSFTTITLFLPIKNYIHRGIPRITG